MWLWFLSKSVVWIDFILDVYGYRGSLYLRMLGLYIWKWRWWFLMLGGCILRLVNVWFYLGWMDLESWCCYVWLWDYINFLRVKYLLMGWICVRLILEIFGVILVICCKIYRCLGVVFVKIFLLVCKSDWIRIFLKFLCLVDWGIL